MAPRLAVSQLILIRDMLVSGEPFTASQIAVAAGCSERYLAVSEHLQIVSVADEASRP
ncbi:hypothetical protein TSTA_053100 [Talaromyces stipitatus ATCC 10500]|uniref:Uncharacterized protein n=1 Tax=Talaromyces stipitatus (strain ATCC 10500 / CBS 375.48 / QM 6759 / NRRL 1006) TaxID=441959 RepID=B8MQV7_TALSN|nr:uncharacterized protein TSTA_053100 [Talaromyces stipitatus ATCC 10500]EED12792.1 hypothetical protein TSTA_053100 [Talaromyces stipitatus ATCC 10500]